MKMKTWHDKASAFVAEDPQHAYRHLPETDRDPVPVLHNDHDWSLDTPLVRCDDVEARKTIGELQRAFTQECRRDADDDRSGIGGEDFENNWASRVLPSRQCALCPHGFSPTVRLHPTWP